jgi:hypothetical protein
VHAAPGGPGHRLARRADASPIHCRRDGGDEGTWIKLGWAYNEWSGAVCWTPRLGDDFPEIVLRGAARLNPGLKVHYGGLPRQLHHYGGFYTRTRDNWR